ncbi:sensor histidine kinase [Stackebrandtia nassauensis]|uniref:histidine kinase n=1 Tax=Stackebrandtia nassauensis (strain DSM 44728 / CIP 108903 / NRRL B-16338 / NBRC 102104 / LLR-40K-21) TaxID=446470 RepID=D3QBS3_STANL|nr:PAS domain-containing sensor histidine kinase [Stackebrandtia nassauensis]ADD44812.1 signal transduction histidine kinase [Stackebrandtia nassauensis DSM 44728]
MSTLGDLIAAHTDLSANTSEHLHRLAAEWQLLADLSFADLLLWAPVRDREGCYICLAQVRPTTGPTAYDDDQVGRVLSGKDAEHLHTSFSEGRIFREGDPVWHGATPARHEAVPVRRRDRQQVVAVVARDTNLSDTRSPSHLELNYLKTADYLIRMLTDGGFPPPLLPGEPTTAPRVGDGLVRIGADGLVRYASPNALSAYRRMGVTGVLSGENLAELTRGLVDDPEKAKDVHRRINRALSGETPRRKEIEARGAVVLVRALPLRPDGQGAGALVLVRDVTEVRRLDRELVTKEATIREIHHRVKNNLQTVAALLRLQARRVGVPQARAALEESVRRVTSIALVHETLSRSSDEAVSFDAIVDKVASMAAEVAAPESQVRPRRVGNFGVLPSEVATPLVMILNELVQNAVEHAYPPGQGGEVVVDVQREGDRLQVTVYDHGRGLPEGFRIDATHRLGLQIVHTLATGELRGTIKLGNREDGGAEAVLDFTIG